ncbi:acyltransferase [Zoogloea sp.]|uniref:acyltransferase family protein n=1 Tax=Zoogloea sp. TaxID=49181 RepID=UPI0014160077|nr:MAG: acyltransferase [Zoogloea sp.]
MTQTVPVSPERFDQQEHLQVIDAVRGYAILIVIAVHTPGHVPELVWPALRVLFMGFYGVQLFFLASAVTLLMSWHRSTDAFAMRSQKFLLRRFFRIAPFYYLAVLIYWFAYQVPAEGFDFEVLLASLLFYNAWSPYLVPTVAGWTPVPGGWSIGVEFCFYFVFPLLASCVTTLRRALAFVALALGVMLLASHFGQQLYPELDAEARANFLYFWPPNQLVIFALGFLLYYLIKDPAVRARIEASRITANQASLAMLGVVLGLSFYGPHKFFDWSTGQPPTHLLMAVCFVPWVLVLFLKPGGLAVNAAICGLGRVSFSAYVLHFMVLRYLGRLLHAVWPLPEAGIYSVAFELVFLTLAVLSVRWLAELSYRVVEQPGIDLGKRLIRALHPRPLPVPGEQTGS